MTLPIRNKSRIFIIKIQSGILIISHFFVIRLGLEPKTYCLEGSCSIQLSYRTSLVVDSLFRKSAAKVGIFSETAKLFREIFARISSGRLLLGCFPVAVDDLAVLGIFLDVNADVARESAHIEVLIAVIKTVELNTLGRVVLEFDGLGTLLE